MSLNHSLSPINRAGQFNDEINTNSLFEKLCVFDTDEVGEVTQTIATKEVRDKAWELLMKEGDVIIKGTDQSDETCRQQALILYMSRLLRPIWDLKIVAR